MLLSKLATVISPKVPVLNVTFMTGFYPSYDIYMRISLNFILFLVAKDVELFHTNPFVLNDPV